ncbi:carnitine O-palmitoyltransferase 1, liver isoform-like isoform X2 [Watersipora subatra]|uniref:carnitine O-palmitoyltransferase 1, liver isoform-like isoform X2 n=1 Tax=Watersipora subatra TaxID=2589382 RepID=UPI00355B40E4
MAEAHSAVAFSFNVTHEGVDVRYNHEALRAVWFSGLHSWKLRFIRFKNRCVNILYPAPPASLFLLTALVMGLQLYSEQDLSYGMIEFFTGFFPECVHDSCEVMAAFFFGVAVWILCVLLWRYTLKLLLLNHSWMYSPFGKMSLPNKLWVALVKLLNGTNPLLYSFQSALPKLPVPSLSSTKKRYLQSIRPLLNDVEYERLSKLAEEFFGGIGNKLQRYLILKSWWSTNYVTDWWEEYVYLRGRSPIMVNSNYYGLDVIFVQPTNRQAARAGNLVYAFLQFRERIDHETLQPLLVNKTVPLDSVQYERLFNTTRIPGVETDVLLHVNGVSHITVLSRGRYYKVYTHDHGHLMHPKDFERMFQEILDDKSSALKGEEKLAALTAGERVAWAKARKSFFATGVNKASLTAIEKSGFVLVLDEECYDYNAEDPSELNRFAKSMLHGKCLDRWFDKSFTLVVSANARVGFNAEHSWADAPVVAQVWEEFVATDLEILGYTEDGHCQGAVSARELRPIRLQWDIPSECLDVAESSLRVAQAIAADVDLHIQVHQEFGKGVIKKCRISPDAFIQLALQVAYFRDAGRFCLTYEASMTRLFREGRTETVRSCTIDSCAFVRAFCEEERSTEELKQLLHVACETHQNGYRDAMTGKGIDRHMFCLYVVSKYLGVDSPFLSEVLSEPWRLSTSQTPHSQMNKINLALYPDHVCTGGGFGPVSDDGYGVSYIIAGENMIFFHVSSKISCPNTNSREFGKKVVTAMADIRRLCGQ